MYIKESASALVSPDKRLGLLKANASRKILEEALSEMITG
jgi:hypothetical protein